jgi:transcriptional regulator with XRE-family HTH domain
MLTPIRIKFGKSLQKLRLKRKLSQKQLAKLVGVHVQYMSRIERGKQNISLENIGRIARALKIKPAILFRGIH